MKISGKFTQSECVEANESVDLHRILINKNRKRWKKIMRRSKNKSHWGEYPDLYQEKYENDNVFGILPPQKRFKIEMLRPVNVWEPQLE